MIRLVALLSFVATGVKVGPALAQGPDISREQRIANEITETIIDGDPLMLHTAGGRDFLAIHTRSPDPQPRGAVVILHGRGQHPDWADVVHPLRVGLAESRWDTLSIQLPVLGKDARYYDYIEIFDQAGPRIDAAIAWLRAGGATRVAVIAHSCGSHMFDHWVRTGGPRALAMFDAYAGIGMGATDYGQPVRASPILEQIRVPVLDVYAENDFPAVRRMAPERQKALLRGGNPKSAQRVLPDADHYFVNRGEVLLRTVVNWLETL